MSIFSARKMHQEFGDTAGLCIPMALDSIMRRSDLPREFYTFFYDEYQKPNPSHNYLVTTLIENFFGAKATPSTNPTPVAKYDAFDACGQSYMPNVTDEPYRERLARAQAVGITEKQLRLQTLLAEAVSRGCNVLFTYNKTDEIEHVAGLEVVDPGASSYQAQYLIRNYVDIQNDRVYAGLDLAGIKPGIATAQEDDFMPLPEISRSRFPAGQSSWELIILPPEPQH